MTLKPEISSELRHMVRDVLREVMAQRGASQRHARVETVRIASDHDLAAFVARVTEPATAGEDPRRQAALHARRSRCLRCSTAGCGIDGRHHRTEDRSAEGRGHASCSAPGAVLTPLARDKARKLGLTIERRR